MNIHEYQAKEILKKYGVPIPNGVAVLDIKQLKNKIKNLNSTNLILKAQIHAGGRGKAGGIKLVKSFEEAIKKTGQVCIQVRDVKGVDDNPFDFEYIKSKIAERLEPKFKNRYKIILVPNITNIN